MTYLPPAFLRRRGIDDIEHFPSLHCIPQFTRKAERGSRQAAVELSNEILSCWLGNKIGLPMDMWRTYRHGGAGHLALEPGLWFNEYKPCVWPVLRSCYAVWRPPEMGTTECYEMIPSKWQARVRNREDFIGMVLFDVWAGAQRYRQALYVGGPNGRLHALFLSHGKMFHALSYAGNIQVSQQLSNLKILIAAHRQALSSWSESAVIRWAHKLKLLHGNTLEQILDYSRTEWQPEGWEDSIREYLTHRYYDISDIAEAVLDALKDMCATYEPK